VAKRMKASKRTVQRTTKPRKTAKRKTAARAAATRTRAKKAKRPTRKPSRVAKAAVLVFGAATNAAATVAQGLPWTKDENDPILLLETDHRRFEELLKRGEDTTTRAVKARKEVLQMLADELNVHELIEEKVLYPALEPHASARDVVLEGYEEHHVADLLLTELRGLSPTNEKWGAKFKVLKESIEHHIQEEEGEMFRLARAVLSRDEQLELGAKMKALRAEHA
jgi:hemerythrin-like domain-containing protein